MTVNTSDKNTRRCVTGYALYVNGMLIAPKSQLQKTVSLSLCEAKYKTTTDRSHEVQFICQVLESMRINIIYLMLMYMDNIARAVKKPLQQI